MSALQAMSHSLIALTIQAAGLIVLGDPLPGALAGIAFFLGREIAQAEYRHISSLPIPKRDRMPMWGGLDPRYWNKKALTDVLYPALAVSAGCAIHYLGAT